MVELRCRSGGSERGGWAQEWAEWWKQSRNRRLKLTVAAGIDVAANGNDNLSDRRN